MPERSFPALFLFAGLGGGALGFQRAREEMQGLRARFHIAGAVDFDAKAAADFRMLTGHECTVADIGKMTAADLREACPEPPSIVFGSPPCLPTGGIVVTEAGDRPIEAVRAGERVLSHTGQHCQVAKVNFRRYRGDLVRIRLAGTAEWQEFTTEHPVWTRRIRRGTTSRYIEAPRFVPAADVKKGNLIGFPVRPAVPGTARAWVESFGDPCLCTRGGNNLDMRYGKPEHVAEMRNKIVDLRPAAEDANLWFLLGVYLADGHHRHDRYEVSFSIGAVDGEEARQVRAALTALGLNWCETNAGRTNGQIKVSAKHLHALCSAFGGRAHDKRIPHALMDLEPEFIESLWRGYRWDGNHLPRRKQVNGGRQTTAPEVWRVPSVSHGLLKDMQRLLLRIGLFGGIRKEWDGGKQVIEGREVNTRPRWSMRVPVGLMKRGNAVFEDGAVWISVKEVERRDYDGMVHNLEVDDDDTYCAPLMATHNCKAHSGCLPIKKAKTRKYQEMNDLLPISISLVLEAWPDSPPALILIENVPRIQNRGRSLIDTTTRLLNQHHYLTRETVHDCGELGGLGQRRRRFLMVARHTRQVPNFWMQPPNKPLRSVGDVIGELPIPLPGSTEGGPMHRLPRMSATNWLRLALIPAGGDWRDLPEQVAVGAGAADPRSECKRREGSIGVTPWSEPSTTVIGQGSVQNGPWQVADPRLSDRPGRHASKYATTPWDRETGTILTTVDVPAGASVVADPRLSDRPGRHTNKYAATGWDQPGKTVTAATEGRIGSGAPSVCDVRLGWDNRKGVYRVGPDGEPATTVIAAGRAYQGQNYADPRVNCSPRAGGYGVLGWDGPSGCIVAAACHDNGAHSVADERIPALVWHRESERFVHDVETKARQPLPVDETPIIIAADGTWHRPMTTLELAALQGLPTKIDGEWAVYGGGAHGVARSLIGNAVPPPTAEAIAQTALRTLMAAELGTWELSCSGVWVEKDAREGAEVMHG